MCVDTFVDQAMNWIYDDLMDLVQYDIPEYRLIQAVEDLVHLENQVRGLPGYDPDIIPRDYKLEF